MFDYACGILLSLFIGAPHVLTAQAPPTLHTLQTTISFQADESSPRVLSIETPGSRDGQIQALKRLSSRCK